MRNILIICTGNTCRSPMASGIINEILKEKNIDDVSVSTAGFAVLEKRPTDETVAVMNEVGIDIKTHKPTWIKRDLTDAADIILCMTKDHKNLLTDSGVQSEKIYVLDVCDPFGHDIDAYRVCREQLKEVISNHFSLILGKETND